MTNLHERILLTRRESNLQSPDQQADAQPTEPPRPALLVFNIFSWNFTEMIKITNSSLWFFFSSKLLKVLHAIKPYKPSVPKKGHWQTRRHQGLHCLHYVQKLLLNMAITKPNQTPPILKKKKKKPVQRVEVEESTRHKCFSDSSGPNQGIHFQGRQLYQNYFCLLFFFKKKLIFSKRKEFAPNTPNGDKSIPVRVASF